MESKLLLSVMLLWMRSGVSSQGLGPLYEIVGNTSSHSDDGSSPEIPLLEPFVYFGQSYDQIYVNHNGHLTFTAPWSSYIPQPFPIYGTRDIIAPFWTDINNAAHGDVYYAQFDSGQFLQQVTQDINEYFPEFDFNAKWIFIASWYEVAYFANPAARTTFQAVLTTDGRYSFVLMNYGNLTPSSRSIEAGYDTINSIHYFTLPGSFSNNAAGNDSVLSKNSNVNVPGRWAFRVDDESTEPLYEVVGNTSSHSDNGSSPQILLLNPFVYFGRSYNQIYVNHNGHLTFDAPWSSYIPQQFPMNGTRDIIAAFWTDLNNELNGDVYYAQFSSGPFLQQVTQDINEYFPELNFKAKWIFIATWYGVAYFSNPGSRTTSQAVLTTDGKFSFALMNYGYLDSTLRNVQAGYDTIDSTNYYTIPGSFSSNATGSNSVFSHNSNVNVPGRWAFRVDQGPAGPLYPIAGNTTQRSLDGSSQIVLQQPFVYFGTSYNQTFVNNNGHVTFTGPWFSSSPESIPLHGTMDFIAPFWTNFDNRVNGLVYYNQFTSGSILEQATKDINEYFPEFNFTAKWVFVATWYEVAYYQNNDAKTTVQAVLISGGQYSFVLLNYGIIAPNDWNVQAGYDTVNSTHYRTIPGSITNNASNDYSAFHLSSNVNVPGRWAFRVDQGPPEPLYEIVGTTSSRLDDGSSPQIQLLDPFVYFGLPYNQIYVNHNGHMTFKAPWSSSMPQQFPMNGSRDIIALFWTNLNNAAGGDIYYGQYTSGHLLYQVTQDINEYFPELQFDAKWIFIATWDEVAYSSNPGTATFQAVLTTDGKYSFVMMNYGYLAPTSMSTQAGYDTVNSPYYFTIPGSFSSSATGGNSVLSQNSNVNVPGRWVFRVDHMSTGPIYEISGTQTSHSDDGSSPQIQLPQPFAYFEHTYSQIYVNYNGHLTFSEPWYSYFPQRIPFGTKDIIVPFWTDLNNAAGGDIYYDQHTSGQLLNQVTRDINEYFPVLNFNAKWVFIATWDKVFYFSHPAPVTFQAVLTSDGNCSFVLLNYGYLAPTTDSIQAGYDTVNSLHYFNLPGSMSSDAAGNNSVFSHNSNVNIPGRWVFRVDLGCKSNDKYYNAGEIVLTDDCSQRCECHGPNDLQCTPVSCTPTQECTIRNGQLGCYDTMSTCTVMGDPHYITFDGALVHFQRTCSYIITENVGNNNNETQFSVVATNSHRGKKRVSFVSSVDVYISNQSDNVHVRIGPNIRVKVNGAEESLPTSAGPFGKVVRQGSYIVFDGVDFKVHFDGRGTLLVRIGQHYQNRITGMCGNFNGDPTDDKVLPNGTMAQNDNDFGTSWKSPTSEAGCGATDKENHGLSDCRFIQKYTELCSVITNTSGPFSSCHLHSDPQPFFDSCVYDLCLYTPANGMLCSDISAYERTCSVLGLNISDWRSALQCDESDPCEQLDCTEYEWCGQKDGVYGCFCDENHRANNESFDSILTCTSSSSTISLSRCQLFEAGLRLDALHLKNNSCTGTLQDGRLVFHFDNEDHQCGTVLKSNETHFMYQNAILGGVKLNTSLIIRTRPVNLIYSCVYPLNEETSMTVKLKPVESNIIKRLPSGKSLYKVRMIPYLDKDFKMAFINSTLEVSLNQKVYVEVRTEGVDQKQISTVLDSCWATPDISPTNPIRWDLIISTCPNPDDKTVAVIQNGVSTVARFLFSMFTFKNSEELHLHCKIHLCLLANNNCAAQCQAGHSMRNRRDVKYQDSTSLSLGPMLLDNSTLVQ